MVLTAWAHFLCKLRTVFITGSVRLFLSVSVSAHCQRCSGSLMCSAASSIAKASQHQQLSLHLPACLWRKRESAGLHLQQIPSSAVGVNTQHYKSGTRPRRSTTIHKWCFRLMGTFPVDLPIGKDNSAINILRVQILVRWEFWVHKK